MSFLLSLFLPKSSEAALEAASEAASEAALEAASEAASKAASEAASKRILCYHVNATGDSQIIKVMTELGCYLEQAVFPEERILFEALPESYLEIHSASASGVRVTRAECELFQISES